MTAIDVIHGGFVHPRRVRTLVEHAAALLPSNATVLDVGTGDGRIAAGLATTRPDLRIRGIDVLVRDDAAIPVDPFNGREIPMPDGSVDAVTLFDVLHHADDPLALLREAARVARQCIVIKDHICDGGVARAILRLMDGVGNHRFGVALPHNYWSSRQWSDALGELDLRADVWQVGQLGLYPWPASLVFERGLHVLARVTGARTA